MTSFCIIIPVHNRKDVTLRCLEELVRIHEVTPEDIYIIDDGSTDGTSEEISEKFSGVNILKGDGDLWWTGAIEKGMRYCYSEGYDFFLWLNDDCYPEKEAIENCLNLAQEKKAIVGGHTYNTIDGQLIHAGATAKASTIGRDNSITDLESDYADCDMTHGNIVCIPRFIVESVGFPNGTDYPHGHGDIEYTLRAKRAGHRVLSTKKVRTFTERAEDPNYERWTSPKFSAKDIWHLITHKRSFSYYRANFKFLVRYFGLKGLVVFLSRYSKKLLIFLLKLAKIK